MRVDVERGEPKPFGLITEETVDGQCGESAGRSAKGDGPP